MKEKIKAPLFNPFSVQESPAEKQEKHLEAENFSPLEPDKKNPDHSGISDLPQRALDHDGAYREYLLNPGGPASEDHLYREISRVIGLSENESKNMEDHLSEITQKVALYLQTDNHEVVSKFVLKLLRKSNHSGSNLSKVHNLHRYLNEILKGNNA